MAELSELLNELVEQRGSDLLVKVGSSPHLRRDGKLLPTDLDKMSPAEIESVAAEILDESVIEELLDVGEVDVAYSVAGVGRFRVNVYRQRGSVSLAIRRVVPGTPSMADLGLPTAVEKLASEDKGLVIVCGQGVSGRTTTAAAIIDFINATMPKHIVTIEDPIEVLHSDKVAMISQREVGADTTTMLDALRRVGRQAPDVVLLSSLPDADVRTEALRTAGSGRLVIAVSDDLSATEAVLSLVDGVPPHRQERVREQVSNVLRGVVCQKLLERADGRGRIPAVEILINTPKVVEGIASGMANLELQRLVAEGEYYGMQTFDQALFQLHRTGVVSLRDALGSASQQEDLRIAFQQAGLHA